MRRFNFEAELQFEAEPRNLQAYYDTLAAADTVEVSTRYAIPAQLQTESYAHTVFELFGQDPELTAVRVDNRLRREAMLQEAGIPQRVALGERALRQAVWFGADTMLSQVEHVVHAVERSPRSGLEIGIVPDPERGPLSDPLLLMQATWDGAILTTDQGTFTMWTDYGELDRLDDGSPRDKETARRKRVVEAHMSAAAFRTDALAIARGILNETS